MISIMIYRYKTFLAVIAIRMWQNTAVLSTGGSSAATALQVQPVCTAVVHRCSC